jgi:hypothetical protein
VREAFRNELARPRLCGEVLPPVDRFAPARILGAATKQFWLPTKPDNPLDETVLKSNRAINGLGQQRGSANGVRICGHSSST